MEGGGETSGLQNGLYIRHQPSNLSTFLLSLPLPHALILSLSRASHAAKCEDLHGDKTHYELRRQYHCAAYKALMAVIMCTQNKIQFYHGFIFKEDLNKVRKMDGRDGREGGRIGDGGDRGEGRGTEGREEG